MQPLFIQDRDRWNAFIASSPYGHILQSWEWGELKERTGQLPLRLALVENGEIRGAAQILLRRLPYGLGTLAYVPKGPVLDYQDEALLASMLSALKRFVAERGLVAVKIEPEVLDGPVAGELERLGLIPADTVQMRSTIWVDLAAPEEEMLARQKQKTRYNIRLAAKKGVTVTHATPAELDDWYTMYEVTARRDGFSIHGLDYYRKVLEVLDSRDRGSDDTPPHPKGTRHPVPGGPAGMATLMLAHHDGDLLAGIVVFCFGGKAQYMYGASSNEKRNLMAPYLLQWEAMRWAKAQGATVYDLWGIPDRLEENEELWGVYRHKRGYGGEIVRYAGAFDLVQTPVRHLVLERIARPLFKRVARLSA